MVVWAWTVTVLLAWITLSTVVGLVVAASIRRVAGDAHVRPSASTRHRLELVRSPGAAGS